MFDDNGSFLLAMFEFFIFFAWFMCLFWVFGDLFRSRDLGGFAKTAWALFLIILPILGMLVYMIARGNGMTERAVAARAEAQKQQAAYIRSVAAPSGGTSSPADEIASAKALLDSGAINESEFQTLKAKVLATSRPPAEVS
ncbi:SHOCT domain-containing protein [Cryptosporangium minutisporangium]|uniref:SHOCT domain-containing protein n=1 Tax=Cryptosporangium minutisporangium TaxID=113569 RepID=A0ABP6SUN3_9ACTN